MNLVRALNTSDEVRAIACAGENTPMIDVMSDLGVSVAPCRFEAVLDDANRNTLGKSLFRKIEWLIAIVKDNVHVFRFTRENNVDYFIARLPLAFMYSAIGARLAGAKVIADADFVASYGTGLRVLSWLGLFVSRRSIGQYRATPQDLGGLAGRKMEAKGFEPIIPGIDTTALESYRVVRDGRKPAGRDAFTLLCAATIHERKNQRILISAVKRVAADNPETRITLKLCGAIKSSAYHEAIQSDIAVLPANLSVEVPGWCEDVHQLMTDSDLLVLSSRDEGVPNVVQEAMYIGLPVLAANAGGLSDLIEHDETGWLAGVDDVDAWARSLSFCIKNPDEMTAASVRARSFADAHFGLEVWGIKYSDAIRRAG